MGFEPTVWNTYNSFQDYRLRPLGHPSRWFLSFCGGRGIRTLEGDKPLHAFQACALGQTMRPLQMCMINIMDYKTDEKKMKVALEQANLAFDKNEVPVGAAIFDSNNNLICANHNRRELDNNPTAHAEILVLQEAAQILGSWRLENTTLAVTLEPDAMCAGAIVIARIKKLIYGAANLKAGAAYSLYNIPQDARLNHHVDIKDNILSHESEAILSSFFDSKR